MEDNNTGKLVKLIYRYIFYCEDFKNNLKDMAEIKFYANKSVIEKMKKEQRTKSKSRHIIFYIFYAKLFDQLSDIVAGRLFKRIVDTEFYTNYLKNGENDIYVIDNYILIQRMYKQYRSEKIKSKLNGTYDFSKMKAEFSNLEWRNFEPSRYKYIDFSKLYEYMVYNNFIEADDPEYRFSMDDVICFYEHDMKNAIDSIKEEYDNLDWIGFNMKDKKYKGVDFEDLYNYMNDNDYNNILNCTDMTIDDVIIRYKEYKKKNKK